MRARLAAITRGQWVLRAAMVVGVLVALCATALVGPWPAPWLVVLVAALSVGWAVAPEQSYGPVAMAFVLFWWGIGLRDGLHPAAMLAAAGLLAAHVAGVVVAHGPARMPLDPATVRLWGRRTLTVFVLAPVTWAFATWVRDAPEPEGLWLAGLGAALVATGVGAAALVAARVDRPR